MFLLAYNQESDEGAVSYAQNGKTSFYAIVLIEQSRRSRQK